MADHEETKKGLTRRGFIKTAAIGAGASAVGGVGILRDAEAAAKEPKWDKEADVVVVGYGGAGAAAAITAHDAGAKVLILEKAATGGGSTYFSGGFFASPRDVGGAVDYLMECARAGDGTHFDIDRDTLTAWAEEAVQNEPWLRSLGAEVFISLKGWFPYKGADSYTTCQLKPDPTGVGLWKALSDAVEARKIPVLYNMSGTELVTREAAGASKCVEVLGVVSKGPDGQTAVKAAKGVVLTCGGFDYDETMMKNFLMPYPKYSVGHLGNTGDAVKLAAKTGAALWHMNVAPGVLCYKFPEVPVAYPSWLQFRAMNLSLIFVNKLGKRFTNEEGTYDVVAKALDNYDTVAMDFVNIPCWSIFDEKARVQGPAGLPIPMGKPVYMWSDDNSEEIKKGWVQKGETMEELAGKIGVDPATLSRTVAAYNKYCEEENDPDFGRTDGLIPLEAPFYAVKGYPGTWGTGGGPRINTKAQVLNVHGDRVARLYAAGNASAVPVGYLYPLSGTFIADAFAMGRIAGRTASAETPW